MNTPNKGDAMPPVAPPSSAPPRAEMTPAEYLKILLDSSFKESATTWSRAGALLTFNSVLFEFYISHIKDHLEYVDTIPAIAISIVGLIASFLNIVLVRISVHYNMIWYKSFVSWAHIQSTLPSLDENSPWKHLDSHIKKHDTLPFQYGSEQHCCIL
jgi:hypothetical protein